MSVFSGMPLFWKQFLLVRVLELCKTMKQDLNGNNLLFVHLTNALRRRSWQIYKVLRASDRLPDEQFKVWKHIFPFSSVGVTRFDADEEQQLTVYMEQITTIITEGIVAYKASFPSSAFTTTSSQTRLRLHQQHPVFFQRDATITMTRMKKPTRKKRLRPLSKQQQNGSMFAHFFMQ